MKAQIRDVFFSRWTYKMARWVHGVIFLYAGVRKLTAPQSFAVVIEAFGSVPQPWMMSIYAWRFRESAANGRRGPVRCAQRRSFGAGSFSGAQWSGLYQPKKDCRENQLFHDGFGKKHVLKEREEAWQGGMYRERPVLPRCPCAWERSKGNGDMGFIQQTDPAESVKDLRLSRQDRPGRARRTSGGSASECGSQFAGGIRYQ